MPRAFEHLESTCNIFFIALLEVLLEPYRYWNVSMRVRSNWDIHVKWEDQLGLIYICIHPCNTCKGNKLSYCWGLRSHQDYSKKSSQHAQWWWTSDRTDTVAVGKRARRQGPRKFPFLYKENFGGDGRWAQFLGRQCRVYELWIVPERPQSSVLFPIRFQVVCTMFPESSSGHAPMFSARSGAWGGVSQDINQPPTLSRGLEVLWYTRRDERTSLSSSMNRSWDLLLVFHVNDRSPDESWTMRGKIDVVPNFREPQNPL